MSFCSNVKNELAAIRPPGCCKSALAYGLLLFGRSFSFKRIAIQTNHETVAQFYSDLARQVYGVETKLSCGGSVRPTYRVEIPSDADRLKILAAADYGMSDSLIDSALFLRDCCTACFLRGAFLACGSMNDPEKEYRAEFSVRNEKTADELWQLLQSRGIVMKKTARGKSTVLYTKESTAIEDLLTLIGAAHKTLDLMDTKIIKSMKNNINRARNCDNANISKTVEASIRQRTAIEYLERTDRLYSLPQELLDAALLRKANPSATLKELCALSGDSLTASGLNHRFNRLIALYEEAQKNKTTLN